MTRCSLTILIHITAILGLFVGGSISNANDVNGLQIIVGVPERIEKNVELAVTNAFESMEYDLYFVSEMERTTLPVGSSAVVGVGYRGCEHALLLAVESRVYCTLLSRATAARLSEANDHKFSAIVVDQPLERQVRVARAVFPSLLSFGVLVSENTASLVNGRTKIQSSLFQPDTPLVKQIKAVIDKADALLAIPDEKIFSRDTLRTVLLTTYGYATPVIGYSRAYVDAGALITSWSSPAQLLRQTVEQIQKDTPTDSPHVIAPGYFSVYINHNIARSLNLVSIITVDPERTFIDGTFP